ncbi:FUSC family protein [Pseudomonas aeruginosa]
MVGVAVAWRTDSLDYVLRSIVAAVKFRSAWGSTCNWIRRFPRRPLCLLLINPVQGAVVGKGWWRAVGTLVGLPLAAFVLTALFAQKMLLFVVALGFWLGLCVGVIEPGPALLPPPRWSPATPCAWRWDRPWSSPRRPSSTSSPAPRR